MSAPRGSATRSRSRPALLAAATALVVGGAVAAGLLVGGSRSAIPDNPSGWPSISLASSLATPAGSWVIVPMGDLSDPSNTFWQIFFRPDGKSQWSLVTPPGVGANGGLAADPGPGEDMTVVFDPTNLLTFSPFAVTSDNGTKWTGGVIPFGIAPVPDVVISSPSQPGQLAALKRGGAEVETGTGTGPKWSVVYTTTQLAGSPAGQGCDVGEVTALASAGSDELVGSTCAAPGPVGIFRAPTGGSSEWQLEGPNLSNGDKYDVLRLSMSGGRVVALVDGRKGAIYSLYGMWSDSQGSGWSESTPLNVGTGTRIVSSGIGPGGSLVVETESRRGSLRASVLSPGPGASWQDLPPLPRGTQSVSLGTDGSTVALSVGVSELTDWKLENGAWLKAQTIEVPIQFGSAS